MKHYVYTIQDDFRNYEVVAPNQKLAKQVVKEFSGCPMCDMTVIKRKVAPDEYQRAGKFVKLINHYSGEVLAEETTEGTKEAAMVCDEYGNEIFFGETIGECQEYCKMHGITGEYGEYIGIGCFFAKDRYFELEDVQEIEKAEPEKEQEQQEETATTETRVVNSNITESEQNAESQFMPDSPYEPNSDCPGLSALIKTMREEAKMTQEEFSSVFHIPKRTLQDWEYEKHSPPKYIIDLLFKAFLIYKKEK